MAAYQALLSRLEAFLDIRTVLICVAVFLIVSWAGHIYQNKARNLPPGPRGWPVLGYGLLETLRNTVPIHEFFQSLSQKYGPVCIYPGPLGQRAVVISGYRATREMCISSQFNWRPPMPKNHVYELLNGLGVIMSSGEAWKEHQRFSLTVLRGFGVGKRSFEDQIATETDYLVKEIKSFEGSPFDPTHLLCNAVSNVICSVVFGKRFEYDDPEFKHLLHLLEDSLKYPVLGFLYRFMPILCKIPFFPKGPLPSMLLLRQKLADIVDDHHATFDSENLRDFIDVYINEMQVKKEQGIETHLSNIELRAVVNDFFLAGTETTSTTLRWACLYMLSFPDVQKRVHDEIDDVVGRDRLPKISDKPNLPYTEAVIKEIQRFACVVSTTVARFTNQDTEFQGFIIPKGTTILANLFTATRDPSIWEKPDEFEPERFLDEHGHVKKIPGQLVFGAGKRSCLGEQLARMELFIFFTHLMHRFSFKNPTATTESINIQPDGGGSVLAPFPYNICAISRA